jgi:hypothetical protein
MAYRSYDSWKCDPIDVDYQRICRDEDMNPIRSQKEAVETLASNLFTSKFDELKMCYAMQKLMTAHNIEADFDVDVEDLSIISTNAAYHQRKSLEQRLEDLKKAMRRHLTMLKDQIYGDQDVDHDTINGAISNLEWLCDEDISEKKVTVRRV